MMDMLDILMAVQPKDQDRYAENMAHYDNFNVALVTDSPSALAVLDDQNQHIDVFVVDNNLDGQIHEMIGAIRSKYPRLLIILVDEEADFGLPGLADDISTEPFYHDDLAKRISGLISERRVETLRSDSLPAVRAFAKQLRGAAGMLGKQKAAVEACLESGYDYVAYYHLEEGEPLRLPLKAQAGLPAVQSIAPKQASADDIMTWVAKTGLTRLASPSDTPNHPLVARGRLGAVACVPVVYGGETFGVIAACRDRPGSITQESILLLELIGAQLGAALSKESLV